MSAAIDYVKRSYRSLALTMQCAILLLATTPVWSNEPEPATPLTGLSYTLQGGLGFSDNRLRQRDDPESDLYLDGVFGFALEGDTPRLAWHGSGQLQASQSLQGGRDEPPRAELALALDWTLLEQRLSWHVAQLAAVEQIDPLLADSPDNRQQTSIFVTGPSLLFGTPSSWLARLDARLAIARADESPAFDHQRKVLIASVKRSSTALLHWTLQAEHSDVDFSHDGTSSDFVRDDILFRVERHLSHGALTLAYGRTAIDRRSGGTLRGPLWQASLRLVPPAGGELQLDYADAFSDAGRDLSLLDDPAERLWQEGRRARIDGALYRLRSLNLTWRHDGPRLSLSLAPFLRRVDYVDTDSVGEGRSRGLRGGLAYRLSPRMTLQADAATARYRFVGLPRQDHDRGLRLALERQMAPRWSVRLGITRFQRRSSQPSADYSENLLSLYFVYRSDA